MASRCTCDRVAYTVDGTTIEGVARIHGDCPNHGLPAVMRWEGAWPPGTGHLRRHALMVERQTGERITHQEAYRRCIPDGETMADPAVYVSRYRMESPREVEARLLEEAR